MFVLFDGPKDSTVINFCNIYNSDIISLQYTACFNVLFVKEHVDVNQSSHTAHQQQPQRIDIFRA